MSLRVLLPSNGSFSTSVSQFPSGPRPPSVSELNLWTLVEWALYGLDVHPLKALKSTQISNPNHWSGCILASSTASVLVMKGPLISNTNTTASHGQNTTLQ